MAGSQHHPVVSGFSRTSDAPATVRRSAPSSGKPSYKEQLELEQLPARIEALEEEQRRLQAAVGDADFYKRPAGEIHEMLGRLEELETLLLDAYTRWDSLDSRTITRPK